MTASRVERIPFTDDAIRVFAESDARHQNWPVVYLLDDGRQVYVGETLDATARMRQHLATPAKRGFLGARIILDDTFNKSACLDLEAFLINAFTGDGRMTVTNLNAGIADRDYFQRTQYRATFLEIFEQLRAAGVFERDIREIENSDLFKLSPFKALNIEQSVAIEGILEGLFDDRERGLERAIVVQGDPGTGKTIVGVSLMKLLHDIKNSDADELIDPDAMFSEFFATGYPELLADVRVGLVVPQQSLRRSIQKVFRKTPGLSADMVLSPFQVGEDARGYDILVVDEAHRLGRRANQSSGTHNLKFGEINKRLFGRDDLSKTQLDWVRACSKHQVLLLDVAQRVRPGDLAMESLEELVHETRRDHHHYSLTSQMRILSGGRDYIEYVRSVLAGTQRSPIAFDDYDLRIFDDLGAMHDAIRGRDREAGLARLIAGFAWEWRSKRDKAVYDIRIDGQQLQWNRTDKDWINSPTSIDEVGSIHTIQGYDLNYAGVIIGPDLRFDAESGRMFIDRDSYFDKKGKENIPRLGIVFTDEDLLEFIRSVYFVLLTRGMRGTYVYVCDPGLRRYLGEYFPLAAPELAN